MTYNTHDNLILVAPRPVRIASSPVHYPPFHSPILHRPQARAPSSRLVAVQTDSFDRLKISDDPVEQDYKGSERSEKESASPRASPRSQLPSEALEEFLSILHPSAFRFPPNSPVVQTSNGNSHAFFTYRRQTPCSISPSLPTEGLGLTLVDRADAVPKENDPALYPFKLLGSKLASPVSRLQTRNPFERHPSYETTWAGLLRPPSVSASPSPSAAALSPAAIPLPLPTPDEMELDIVS